MSRQTLTRCERGQVLCLSHCGAHEGLMHRGLGGWASSDSNELRGYPCALVPLRKSSYPREGAFMLEAELALGVVPVFASKDDAGQAVQQPVAGLYETFLRPAAKAAMLPLQHSWPHKQE